MGPELGPAGTIAMAAAGAVGVSFGSRPASLPFPKRPGSPHYEHAIMKSLFPLIALLLSIAVPASADDKPAKSATPSLSDLGHSFKNALTEEETRLLIEYMRDSVLAAFNDEEVSLPPDLAFKLEVLMQRLKKESNYYLDNLMKQLEEDIKRSLKETMEVPPPVPYVPPELPQLLPAPLPTPLPTPAQPPASAPQPPTTFYVPPAPAYVPPPTNYAPAPWGYAPWFYLPQPWSVPPLPAEPERTH